MHQYNIKNSKIFITGGAGFIASHMTRILARDNEVILYDNLHNNAYKNTNLKSNSNVKLIQADILDLNTLKKSIDPDVEYVIHSAAIAGVTTVNSDPTRTLRVNIIGTFNILDAIQHLTHLKKFVEFSTSEVFGQCSYKSKEHEINPKLVIHERRWTYAMSKLAGEFITHAYHLKHDLPTVTVRPFNIYGPNQVGVGAIHHFILQALKNETLYINNDGTQIRSWCYVDDFVHGLLLALSSPESIGKTYNIGTPISAITVFELAKLIISLTNSRSQIENRKINYEDVHVRIPDIDSIRNDLNFEPLIALDEGLKRTITWYKNNILIRKKMTEMESCEI